VNTSAKVTLLETFMKTCGPVEKWTTLQCRTFDQLYQKLKDQDKKIEEAQDKCTFCGSGKVYRKRRAKPLP
jgi:hypothetical protein